MARRKTDPPGKAEPPEGPTAARDGAPSEDELAKRRAEKSANGTSVAERQANGEAEPDEELFPLGTVEGDPTVTHKNLIKAGARVTVKAKLTTEAVPLIGGGLFHPETEAAFLVQALPGKVLQIPKHEERGGKQVVKEWDLVQELRAVHVQGADAMFTREQVLDMLHEAGVPERTVTRLLGNGQAQASG